MTRFPFISLLLLLVACGGPIGPFSGGQLSGDLGTQPVTDWSFTQEHETVQLEVNPANPHSVNTWCVGLGPALYVPTSMILGPTDPDERGWVGFVKQDPNLRIRIDGTVYERTAVRVTDADEYETALRALEAKYEEDPTDRDPERVIWIFRLDPRAD
ncbi:MAG: hypothetical protein GY946_07020 [bacterium]|nr:hypothetical protein [bacterium]